MKEQSESRQVPVTNRIDIPACSWAEAVAFRRWGKRLRSGDVEVPDILCKTESSLRDSMLLLHPCAALTYSRCVKLRKIRNLSSISDFVRFCRRSGPNRSTANDPMTPP